MSAKVVMCEIYKNRRFAYQNGFIFNETIQRVEYHQKTTTGTLFGPNCSVVEGKMASEVLQRHGCM